MPNTESILKFSFVVLCFINAFATRSRKKDANLLRAAMFFTVLADFHMVLFGNNVPGLVCFCAVQSLYCVRYAGIRYAAALWGVLACAACVLFALKADALNFFTVLYALSFAASITAVYRAKQYAPPNRILTRLGMTLFLLCDVNVALTNAAIPFLAAHSRLTYLLLWIFYLPSQLILSFSAKDFSKKAPRIF